MKRAKSLRLFAFIVCALSVALLSGCDVMSSLAIIPVVGAISSSREEEEGEFLAKFIEYGETGWQDEACGMYFTYLDGYAYYYTEVWGQVEIEGISRRARFEIARRGEMRIYISAGAEFDKFDIHAATVNLKFAGDEIVCEEVVADKLGVNLNNLRLKCRTPEKVMPHEEGFVAAYADVNHVLEVHYTDMTEYYSGTARVVVDGLIKAVDIALSLRADGTFVICQRKDLGVDPDEILAFGTYVIANNTTTVLTFEEGGIFDGRPFESYPKLALSNFYYNA